MALLKNSASFVCQPARLLILVILWCVTALAVTNVSAQNREAEYRLKAVFLFNFAQFVDWPPEAFPDAQSPLIIGILGTDPFGKVLDQTLQNEIVNDHPLQVRRYRSIDEIKNCHVLFISSSESSNLQPILQKLRNRPILTVGESEGFARAGGMVRFITEKQKIRFRINVDAAREANVTISSKLLRVAEITSTVKE